MLTREDNIVTLGIVTSGREVSTLGDRARCYVTIRICEAEIIEQRYISLVVLPRRYLDADEQGEVGFSMEIIVFVSSR